MPAAFSVSSVLGLLRSGLESNWWGLACPYHCGPSSAWSLCLALLAGFALGILSGLALSVLLALKLGILSCPSALDPPEAHRPRPSGGLSPGADRILAYLHE